MHETMDGAIYTENGLFGIARRGFTIFGFDIYWYAVCIVCGMIGAAALSALLMKRRNMSPDLIFLLFVVCIPTAVICARLFSCLTDPRLGIQAFFDFRDGGLSVTGGVLGGVFAGFVVCRIKKVSFLRAADCVVVNILIAQSLGRWGNFFNGEVYSQAEVTNPALQWFPFAVPISPSASDWTVGGIGGFSDPNATWYYAFFFYESIANLIGWAILFTLAWKMKKKPNGILTCSYFVWYGIVRSIMEPLRDPEFILDRGGVMWSELFSILMVGLGICAILVLLILNFRKEGAFFGSRTGDPCGISEYMTPYKDDEPYYSTINMFGDKYPPAPPKKKKGEDGGAPSGAADDAPAGASEDEKPEDGGGDA